jgi:hypothetical protein
MARPPESIFCPKGDWTTIEYYLGTLVLTKTYFADPAVRVRWRYFSAGLPPYWAGKFTGHAQITLWPSASTWLEFKPDEDVNVTWEPSDYALGEGPPDPIDELAH